MQLIKERNCVCFCDDVCLCVGVSWWINQYKKKKKFWALYRTYIDLLPLIDITDEPGEAKESDQGEKLGQSQDPQGPSGL